MKLMQAEHSSWDMHAVHAKIIRHYVFFSNFNNIESCTSFPFLRVPNCSVDSDFVRISSRCFVKVEQVATVMVAAARIATAFNRIRQERPYVPGSSYTVSSTQVSLTPKRRLNGFSHF